MSTSHKVIKAMSLFSGVQAIGIVCSVVRAKLIAMWIGPAGVGLLGIFNNALDMVSTTTQFNFRQSSVRDISATASSTRAPRIAYAVRWWARRLGVFGAAVMLAAAPALSMASFADTSHWWAFALLAVAVFALALANGEQALMQGHGELKQLARSTVWGSVAGTALSIPLYYLYGIDSIVPSLLIFAIAGMVAARIGCSVRSQRIDRDESRAIGKAFIKLGFYLTVSSLASTAASYAFLSYLNVKSPEATGIYQAGYTLIVKYVGLVFTALSMEYYPRLARVATRPRMTSLVVSHELAVLMCVMSVIVAIFAAAASLMLRVLYSAEFLPALPIVTIGIGGAVLRAISYCMSYVIVARADGRTFVAIDVASAVIGLCLNIGMYQTWGLAGLGASYVLWYAIYTAMAWTVYRHRYGMRITRRAALVAAATVAITAAAIALSYASPWLSLTMLIPAGWLCLGQAPRARKN